MTSVASLIPELEAVLQNGSQAKRGRTLRRITHLFLNGASLYSDEHVKLFDDVIGRLVDEIESKARAELSRNLAPVGNAPVEVMRRLARDDDIEVAGPVLVASRRVPEADLVDIANSKSQAHLLAIAGRIAINEAVTDVLVRRGDSEVARNVADNSGARFSDDSFSTLVRRAEKDGVLAEKVGLRSDIPPRLFRELIIHATEVVQQRLLASAREETRAEIRRVLAKVSGEMRAKAPPRDYTSAQATVMALQRAGRLGESELSDFAKANRFEETVVALSALCGVPLDVVDRLMTGERPDPVLILCKAVKHGWPTARAIIQVRAGNKPVSGQTLDSARANFDRLSPSTAARVVRFWQLRQTAGEPE